MTSTIKPTKAFWIISGIALFWNLLGIMAYLGQAYMTEEMLTALPDGDQAYYNNIPAWVTAAFAIAVFGGALGSLALLLRKKWAKIVLLVSLIAVLLQFIYNTLLQSYMEVTGEKLFMPLVVIIIAVFLVWFAKKSEKEGWIR